MSMRQVDGDVVLNGALPSGVSTSPTVAFGPTVADLLVMIHVTALTGTGPTLLVQIQQSADGSTGWTTITGADSASITAVGNSVTNARLTMPYVRVIATVGGTATPTVTARVAVMVFAE